MFTYPHTAPTAGDDPTFPDYVLGLMLLAEDGDIAATISLVNALELSAERNMMESDIVEALLGLIIPPYNDLIAPAKRHIVQLIEQAHAGRSQSMIELIVALNNGDGYGRRVLRTIFEVEPPTFEQIEQLSRKPLIELMCKYPWAFRALTVSLTEGVGRMEPDEDERPILELILEANLRLRFHALVHRNSQTKADINQLGRDGLEDETFARVAKEKFGLDRPFFHILAGRTGYLTEIPFSFPEGP